MCRGGFAEDKHFDRFGCKCIIWDKGNLKDGMTQIDSFYGDA